MAWLSNFFGRGEIREVCVEAETDEESLEAGIKLLDKMRDDENWEETREKEFYCGICKWVPISQYREHLSKH